jgi:hypothetical protein
MSQTQYRQHIHCLKPIINVVNNSNPRQYKLEGLYTDEKLTEKYTDLCPEQIMYQSLDIILSMVKHERLYIHNLKVASNTSDLYEALIKNGCTPHPQNKGITVSVPCNSRYDTKVSVHSSSIIVHIGCTHNPIEYSKSGILSLAAHLGEIIFYLKTLSKVEFLCEPVHNWRLTHMHLNRDSVNSDFPKGFTLNTILGHTCVYKHNSPDGTSKIRMEENLSPNTTILEEIQTDRFQKAIQTHDS